MEKQLAEYILKYVNRPQNFSVGDIVRVHYKIIESGDKERIQIYQGTVIAIQNKALGKSITVRKISYNIGVERIFPLYAPTIDKIEKVRSNYVRRAKLYYLRHKSSKASRLKEIKRSPEPDLFYDKAMAYQKQMTPKAETVEVTEPNPTP